jgi:transposase InsO family protein
MEDVPVQSRRWNRVDRFVRRAHNIVQAALWSSDSASRSTAAGCCQRNSNPSAEWIAGQVTDAFPWNQAPQHLIRDRDAAFGPAYTRCIRAMGIRDHPMAPRSPWQNGHVERLIGSICRECLDHVVVFGEAHLRRVLKTYASYYNKVRTHLSLNKNAPDFRRPVPVGEIAAIPILGGLHHQYVRR